MTSCDWYSSPIPHQSNSLKVPWKLSCDIASVADVAKLVSALESCTVCEGNRDTNLLALASCEKGVFKDLTSTLREAGSCSCWK